MMDKRRKDLKWTLFLLVITLLFLPPLQVNAEDTLAVSVKAVLPENQLNSEVTYYDLRMKPGQEQDIELQLINSSEEEQIVLLQINDATTNDTGSIDYSDRGGSVERDNSLSIALSDVASVDEEVTIPANSTTSVNIHLKMPEQEFDGLVLGGIRITSKEKETTASSEKADGSMQIKNKIAYTVGMNLTENDHAVKADLNLIRVFADQVSGRNAVKANIQNYQAAILEEMEYTAQVYQAGSDEILHQASASNYRFAPNSNFNFDISWENQPFRAGKYQLKMTAESKDTGQKWEWDEEFEITADEAKRLNESAIDLDVDNTKLYIMIGLGIFAGLVLLVVLLIFLKKRKDKRRQEEDLRRKKILENKKRQRKTSGMAQSTVGNSSSRKRSQKSRK